jgi:hypothetical protein
MAHRASNSPLARDIVSALAKGAVDNDLVQSTLKEPELLIVELVDEQLRTRPLGWRVIAKREIARPASYQRTASNRLS